MALRKMDNWSEHARYVADEMERCLIRLQHVEPFDYERAAGRCLGQFQMARPLTKGSQFTFASLEGALLAFDLWCKQMDLLHHLRYGERDA